MNFKHIGKILIVLTVIITAVFIVSRWDNNPPEQENQNEEIQRESISLDKFQSLEEYKQFLDNIEAANPSTIKIHSTHSTTIDALPIYWVSLGDIENKPVIFLIAGQHPYNELAGPKLLLNSLSDILNPSDVKSDYNDYLLENYAFIFIPIVNTWGYFESDGGKHHNGNANSVKNPELIDWHDNTNYSNYYGVNLNRNYDINWENYPNLPFSVKDLWNGTDYGFANYFMMPYYKNEDGVEVYDPTKENVERLLKPDSEIYDYKGESPFSESETKLVKYIFDTYNVIGFFDLHTMNPWEKENDALLSKKFDSGEIKSEINGQIEKLKKAYPEAGIEDTNWGVLEDYDNNGPFASNWSVQAMHVPSYVWEMGTDFESEILIQAYTDIIFSGIEWFDYLYKQ